METATGNTGFPHRLVVDSPVQQLELEQDEEVMAGIIFIIVILIPILVLCGWGGIACCYYHSRIKPTAHLCVRPHTVVPAELRGSWHVGLFDCFSDCQSCLCAWCCSFFLLSENFYRAGWSTALMNVGDPCKQFFCTCCGLLCALHYCSFYVACLLAAFRGGLTQEPQGFGGMVPHDVRFGIQTNYFESVLVWLCCGPCAMVQEHRQIKALNEHPGTVVRPLAIQMGVPGQMVMNQPMMPPPTIVAPSTTGSP